ncbi:hypothetical protein [Aestuariibius sp. HNIBRBA575]|uniref:hypothetical protein n=1 Tax=Aestuariibius sp. HNIBRBA575 TaxID=3233343 RepID=UPI0034A1123F
MSRRPINEVIVVLKEEVSELTKITSSLDEHFVEMPQKIEGSENLILVQRIDTLHQYLHDISNLLSVVGSSIPESLLMDVSNIHDVIILDDLRRRVAGQLDESALHLSSVGNVELF